MRKIFISTAFVAIFALPAVSEAQWVQYEPPQQYVMYPAPPTVIYNPPPVMIQVMPEPPQVVVVPVRPEKRVEARIQGDGVSVVTQCAHCTVTNTVYTERAKAGNGNGKKKEAKPMPSTAKPWWDDPNSLWLWLIAAAIAILTLLAILFGRPLWGGSRQGPSGPIPPPVPWPMPDAPAVPAAPRRPRQRVHTKKCQHEGCPHTVAICCHAGDNDRDVQARLPDGQAS